MKDLSTVTSSQSQRHWNGYQALSSQDHKMSRQTPETRESRSECWLQTPKNQRKAAAAAYKKHVYLCKEDKSPSPEHTLSSKGTRLGHSTCRDHSRRAGPFEEELCAGKICREARPLPKARRHIRKPRQCPAAAFKFPAGELSCMLNVSYHSKSTGRSAIRGRDVGLSSVDHLWDNIFLPKIRPLKDGLSRNSIYLPREGKDLTCTAGATWKIKLRRER